MPRKAKTSDPIFGLIEAHKKAVAVFRRKATALQNLKGRLDDRKDQSRLHFERRLTCRGPLFDVGGSKYDPFDVVRSREQLAIYVHSRFESLTRALGPIAATRIARHEKAALRELQCSYDAFQEAHIKKREATGLPAREHAVEIADRARAEAMKLLIAEPPATPAGRKALANYLTAQSPADAPWWVMKAALESLA